MDKDYIKNKEMIDNSIRRLVNEVHNYLGSTPELPQISNLDELIEAVQAVDYWFSVTPESELDEPTDKPVRMC